MNRQEANLKLLEHLTTLVKENPELRFGQTLLGFHFVTEITNSEFMPIGWRNEFYLESEELLKRVEKQIEKILS